jgi:hypothetical protein
MRFQRNTQKESERRVLWLTWSYPPGCNPPRHVLSEDEPVFDEEEGEEGEETGRAGSRLAGMRG